MVATGPPIVNSVVLSSFIASPNCEVNTSNLNLPVLITLQHDVRYCINLLYSWKCCVSGNTTWESTMCLLKHVSVLGICC